MTHATPRLLAGNNLAVLVAAHALARRGRPVTLLTDGRAPGGHFAGMQIDGSDFDIGMVMLERPPVAPDAAPGRPPYRPQVRNDWTRFAADVARWMDTHVALRRVATPTVQVEGRSGPDYLIANRLDLLAGTGGGALQAPGPDDGRHPSHKVAGPAYEHLSYAEAAALHHGVDWHGRWIEPFVRKLLDAGSQDFLARYHRTGWVPLYYPETLDAARRGELVALPEYPFFTTPGGFVGEVVAQLAADIVRTPGCRIERAPLTGLRHDGGRWHLQCEGTQAAASQVALGLAPERLQALLGLPAAAPQRAASVALLFARVRAAAIGRPLGCHMVVEPAFASYRVVDQDALAGRDAGWHRVVIEASPRALAERAGSDAPAALQAVLADELRTLLQLPAEADLQVLKCFVARGALVLPTAEAVTQGRSSAAAFAEATPGACLSGALLGFGVASFNDQIVQGLQIAEELA